MNNIDAEKIKILQIGPISYVGGVSIHIKRLTQLLRDEINFSIIDDSPVDVCLYNYINIRDYKNFKKIIAQVRSSDLIHIHSGNWVIRIFTLFLSIIFNKKNIVTLHSYRVSKVVNILTSVFLHKSTNIIAVNDKIANRLSKKLKKKTIIREAFVPPALVTEVLPEDLREIIQKQNEKVLICANAFRIQKYLGGELYGLDQCIEVAKKAKNNNFQLHIIFVIGTIRDKDLEYFNFFKSLITQNEIEDYITIYPKTISFVELIKSCNIVVRPTLTDGDALTIREALYLKKQVIASDIVNRPKGTVVYKTADSEDLYNKICEVSKSNLEKELEQKPGIDYKSFYLSLYNNATTHAKTIQRRNAGTGSA